MTSNEMREVARECALRQRGTQGYLPKTQEEAADFTPHQWVIDAMVQAYCRGVGDERRDVRSRILNTLLGG